MKELHRYRVKEVKDIDCLTDKKGFASFHLTPECDDSVLSVPISSIVCNLVSPNSGNINCTVIANPNPGTYKVQFQLVASGHQVNTEVCNAKLASTSLVIPFHFCLETLTPIYGMVSYSLGVAINNNILVSDGNDVCILQNSGTLIQRLSEFNVGVMVAKNCCYVGGIFTTDSTVYVIYNGHVSRHLI